MRKRSASGNNKDANFVGRQQLALLPSTFSALQARLVCSTSVLTSSFNASIALALSSSASAAGSFPAREKIWRD